MIEKQTLTGLSASDKVIMVILKGVPNQLNTIADLFLMLADNGVNIDMISQLPIDDKTINVSFTAGADDMDDIDEVLERFIKVHQDIHVETNNEVIKLSVVGQAMRHQQGVAARLYKLLADNHIEFKLVTTSEISISYIIDKENKDKAVEVIAKTFNLGDIHA